VFHEEENNNKDAVGGVKNPKTAAEHAAARLDMVVTDGDEDSVFTLGNLLSPTKIRQQVASSLLPAASGVLWGDSISVQSRATMDTRLSATEQTMQTLAEDMEKRFDDSMDRFFNRMQLVKQTSEQDQQPPGGASVRDQNG